MSVNMFRKARWLWAMAVLLALVVAAGGCTKKLTVEDIVAKVKEVVASTNDGHAVIEVTAKVQSESVRAVIEVWGKQPNKARAKVLETDRGEFADAVIVTDGQTAWFYSPVENQVIVADVSDIPVDAQVIIQDMEGLMQWVLDVSEVELLGEEDVAGAKTHKLSLTPKEDEERPLPITGTATLWVDQEQWIVLKAHFVAPNLGEGTMQVRSFELNPGLDDEIFTFEAPAGVEVINAEDEKTRHTTLDEAEAQAGFDLLTPAYLPDGSTLIDVLKVREAFVLLYDLDGANSTVTQSQGELPPGSFGEPGAGESVTVRGVQATLVASEALGASLLTWQENGIGFVIAGRIGGDEAIKIAESLQ